MIQIEWNEFKGLIDQVENNIPFVHTTHPDGHYEIYTSIGNLEIKCFLKDQSSDWTDFDTNYKAESGKDRKSSPPPFAQPDYRTKRESNGEWKTCIANSNTNIDYLISEERYATGGEVIFKDAKEGDYVSACVYDKDGVIPIAYRAALCENYPVVAEYINKKFLKPTEAGGYGTMVCDTYPLSAKISAGLYLRVTYHATNEAGDRKAVVNYNLNKKL